MKLPLKLPVIASPATPDYHDFSPPLLRLQEAPPNPLGRAVLRVLAGMLGLLILWALLGRLDIVAVADGKLVPQSYLKIVQPAEAGIVKEIRVREGETVKAGQVLMRMDTLITEADAQSIEADWQRRRLALRRIDAELGGTPFRPEPDDPPALAGEIDAQYRANRAAIEAALAEERSRLLKAKAELASAQQVQNKLAEILPHYREQDKAYDKLVKDGFAGGLMASDKRRERIEKEQELKTQAHLIESARASIAQSEKKLAQLDSDYRRSLHAERSEAQATVDRLAQERAKQAHRKDLLELRASQDSVVKELATHTTGTVVQPGTVLLTLLPTEETLRAEVWISNEDIGFVRQGQPVKLKFAAFPFQKYGMVEGTVEHVSADAADGGMGGGAAPNEGGQRKAQPLVYKALVTLKAMNLEIDGARFGLAAGMRTSAEIMLGTRTVAEYLLSPVRKAWHEAARER
ncbi:HlyD family type I secretion periplasmic adaptor subunit [Accumulibacter sp.]|jgi:hemolysin D|uniref:HlyD family type I secretion periplasmic adaptor subunit n=1 Tax=Accumulibacter sp. TaxID=2053492 RepID=UPI001AC6043E|nr:HlyD family type I secretion periplasmic adaptor subunit [Accumulibacter sp.]MBN8452331.1 HlyD family type I secretion periplasmic adaptor subunit [Accumulibacter sp.]